MKKFVCTVCGYVYEGEAAPEKRPQVWATLPTTSNNYGTSLSA